MSGNYPVQSDSILRRGEETTEIGAGVHGKGFIWSRFCFSLISDMHHNTEPLELEKYKCLCIIVNSVLFWPIRKLN
jgi:hypothetical protein